MIDHSTYEAAERQREDAEYLPRLKSIFKTHGAAYVGANFPIISSQFPPDFIERHVWVRGDYQRSQRVYLIHEYGEAA